jgi:hypothetical protein
MEIDCAEMTRNLMAAARRYPHCHVASCECRETSGEWSPGCHCPGHWRVMDATFGKGNWTLADASASAEQGKPLREAEKEEGE